MNLITAFDSPSLHPAIYSFVNNLYKGSVVLSVLPNSRAAVELQELCWDRDLVCAPVGDNPMLSAYAEEKYRPTAVITIDNYRYGMYAPFAEVPGAAAIVSTSGSTGSPKGVVLSKSAITHNSGVYLDYLRKAGVSKLATCLPLSHVNAYFGGLIPVALSSRTIHPLQFYLYDRPFDPVQYFEFIHQNKVEVAHVVPYLIQQLIENDVAWPPSLRFVVSAAAAVSPALAREFHRRYGNKLVQGYGTSELVNFSFLTPWEWTQKKNNYLWEMEFLDKYPPVGYNVSKDYQVFRARGGELHAKGPNLFEGYFEDVEATRNSFSLDNFMTGDLVQESVDGVWRINGRIKEVLNIQGETTSPVMLERAFSESYGFSEPIVYPVEVETGDVVGLHLEETEPELLVIATYLYKEAKYRPDVVTTGPFPRTETNKPQRLLAAKQQTALVYPDAFMATVIRDTRAFLQMFLPELECIASKADSVPAYMTTMIGHAREFLLNYGKRGRDYTGSKIAILNDAYEALYAVRNQLPDHSNGHFVFKDKPQLWERLMCERPMGDYAILASNYLNKFDLQNLSVLEVGAGVGNTSRLINPPRKYITTDLKKTLLDMYNVPGHHATLDFNSPQDVYAVLKDYGTFDIVFGTNAIHASLQPQVAVGLLSILVNPGGKLILAEGIPTTTGKPWPLSWFFDLFQGWWNIGGFLPRAVLLSYIAEHFQYPGFARLRYGRYDVGGLVFGTKVHDAHK